MQNLIEILRDSNAAGLGSGSGMLHLLSVFLVILMWLVHVLCYMCMSVQLYIVLRYSRSSQNFKHLDNILGNGFNIPTVVPLHRLMIYSTDFHTYTLHIISIYLRSPGCPRRRELLPSMLVSKEGVQTSDSKEQT
jgi:hypothetical protein